MKVFRFRVSRPTDNGRIISTMHNIRSIDMSEGLDVVTRMVEDEFVNNDYELARNGMVKIEFISLNLNHIG